MNRGLISPVEKKVDFEVYTTTDSVPPANPHRYISMHTLISSKRSLSNWKVEFGIIVCTLAITGYAGMPIYAILCPLHAAA